jgi:hypothetical protein
MRLARRFVVAWKGAAFIGVGLCALAVQAQAPHSAVIRIYRDHFEVDGQRFNSIDELRQSWPQESEQRG